MGGLGWVGLGWIGVGLGWEGEGEGGRAESLASSGSVSFSLRTHGRMGPMHACMHAWVGGRAAGRMVGGLVGSEEAQRQRANRGLVALQAAPGVGGALSAMGRADVYCVYFRGVRGPSGAGAVAPRAAPMALSSMRRTWPREIVLGSSAPGLGWAEARLAKCPNRPPWIRLPAGPIPSWGHQHTSWVLSSLSDRVACASGWVLCPCAMTGPRALRGAERAHDPRHLQTR